jgi:hypothetical protein
MFGHVSREAAESFHDVSGWIMTVLAFGLLMGLCWLLQGESGAAVPGDGRPVAAKGAAR